MSSCLVVYGNVFNLTQCSKYTSAAEPLIQSLGERLSAGGIPDAVEGGFPWQRVVVFEWPSHEGALDFWHSLKYAEIKQLRAGVAEFQAITIEGLLLV